MTTIIAKQEPEQPVERNWVREMDVYPGAAFARFGEKGKPSILMVVCPSLNEMYLTCIAHPEGKEGHHIISAYPRTKKGITSFLNDFKYHPVTELNIGFVAPTLKKD